MSTENLEFQTLGNSHIEEIIARFTRLHEGNGCLEGFCPLHADNSPTGDLMVFPEKGVFKCRKCGNKGGIVQFLSSLFSIPYPEVIQMLASFQDVEYTIPLDEASPEQRIYRANKFSLDYYSQQLNSANGRSVGYSYFKSRGLSDAIIREFHLGYSPENSSELVDAATKNGFKNEDLIATGSFYENSQHRLHDRFAGRVIFPWIDIAGRCVGFNGRKLASQTKGVDQKYVNSPSTTIYNKGNELFGLYQARQHIVENDLVYIVEGQFDMIAMYQSGIKNCVANSGTALSLAQVLTLKRFTNNVVEIYDADDAGIKAALRGLNLFLQFGMNVRVLLLPQGMDPDEYIKDQGAAQFLNYVQTHSEDFISFKINLVGKDADDDPDQIFSLIKDVASSIACVSDRNETNRLIRMAAQRFSLNPQMIAEEVKNAKLTNSQQSVAAHTTKQSEKIKIENVDFVDAPAINEELNYKLKTREYNIIKYIVRHGERNIAIVNDEQVTVAQYIKYALKEVKEKNGNEFFHDIYNNILSIALDKKTNFKASTLFVNYHDRDISALAAAILASDEQISTIFTHTDDAPRNPRIKRIAEQRQKEASTNQDVLNIIREQEIRRESISLQNEINTLFRELVCVITEYRKEILVVQKRVAFYKLQNSLDTEEQQNLMQQIAEINHTLQNF